eukprot:641846_1
MICNHHNPQRKSSKSSCQPQPILELELDRDRDHATDHLEHHHLQLLAVDHIMISILLNIDLLHNIDLRMLDIHNSTWRIRLLIHHGSCHRIGIKQKALSRTIICEFHCVATVRKQIPMVYIVKGVSSLLSKTKRESIDIETTKLAGEDVAVNVVEIKTPVLLWRQYSEPEAKAMREIERD